MAFIGVHAGVNSEKPARFQQSLLWQNPIQIINNNNNTIFTCISQVLHSYGVKPRDPTVNLNDDTLRGLEDDGAII